MKSITWIIILIYCKAAILPGMCNVKYYGTYTILSDFLPLFHRYIDMTMPRKFKII